MINKKEFEEVIDSARRELQDELERTEQEKAAFESFLSQIKRMDTKASHPASRIPADTSSSTGTTILPSSHKVLQEQPDCSDTVREAYEQTVMSLSFFDDEYGESYEEAIHQEFGPDIATVLFGNGNFTQTMKKMLVAHVNEAQRKREDFIQSCEHELSSVNTAESKLRSILDQLQTYQGMSFQKKKLDTLHSVESKITTLEKRCDQVATERQSNIQRYRVKYSLTPDDCDLPAYLYKSIECDYPVLYLCSKIGDNIKKTKENIRNESIYRVL
jgi:predicted nuclease with TOPRIM domain